MAVAALRTVLFTVVFYLGSIFWSVAAAAGAATGPRAMRWAVKGWAGYHRWCATHLLGIRTRIDGRVPDEPVLVAIKHQSMYEAVETLAVFERPVVVLKQELARIPFWGWAARRYGVMVVDREGGAASLRRMLADGRAAVAANRPIVIFPEGTRVPVGEAPPLQAGFAGLYKLLKLPVVPVALDSGRLWPRRGFAKRAGAVTWRFGEPIPAGLPREEIERRVHAAINAMQGAGPGPSTMAGPT